MKLLSLLKRKFKHYKHKRHMMIWERQMMSFVILETNLIMFAMLLMMWIFLDGVAFPVVNMGMATVAYPYWRLDCNYYKYRIEVKRIMRKLSHDGKVPIKFL